MGDLIVSFLGQTAHSILIGGPAQNLLVATLSRSPEQLERQGLSVRDSDTRGEILSGSVYSVVVSKEENLLHND